MADVAGAILATSKVARRIEPTFSIDASIGALRRSGHREAAIRIESLLARCRQAASAVGNFDHNQHADALKQDASEVVDELNRGLGMGRHRRVSRLVGSQAQSGLRRFGSKTAILLVAIAWSISALDASVASDAMGTDSSGTTLASPPKDSTDRGRRAVLTVDESTDRLRRKQIACSPVRGKVPIGRRLGHTQRPFVFQFGQCLHETG